MKVLVTDKINEVAKKLIETKDIKVDLLPTMDEAELCKKIADYDALMVRSQTKVTPRVIEAGKKLKIIGRAGVGVDNINLETATSRGIIVVNSPDGNTNAAAEHTLALMLAMSRNIPQACASTKEGLWERSKFVGTEVFGKTLGIIGLGKIGMHVAKVASALGMKIVVFDPYTTEEKVCAEGFEPISQLDDFWGKCDFITVHVPKTAETTHLINKDSISKMKDGVNLINCARGGIIDEEALREAIISGKVYSAALDVYETEPDVKASPLFGVEGHIVLTPHLGASTEEAQMKVAIDVATQIKAVLEGGSASSAVNIPSLRPEKLEPVRDYMLLAQNLGELAQQISEGSLKSAEIKVRGTLSELDVSPLETAVIRGVFSSFMQDVNYVNAPILAKNRGINITTSKSATSGDYIGAIEVKLTTDKGEFSASGALIAKNIKRIIKINKYTTSIEPEEHLLIVPHENKPGMIARVATVIGGHDINISHMVVSPDVNAQNTSIMLINTDRPVPKQALDEIAKIDGLHTSKYVHLSN